MVKDMQDILLAGDEPGTGQDDGTGQGQAGAVGSGASGAQDKGGGAAAASPQQWAEEEEGEDDDDMPSQVCVRCKRWLWHDGLGERQGNKAGAFWGSKVTELNPLLGGCQNLVFVT